MPIQPHAPEDTDFLKALFFGPHGAGKTRLLGSAEDDERTAPMAFLNFEGGARSLVGRPMNVFDVNSWEDYNDIYAQLSGGKARAKIGPHAGEPYKSVGIDSISETQVFGLLNILDMDKKRPDANILSEADWGIILIQMRRFLRHWRDLQMHVFMTALAGRFLRPRMGYVMEPLLQGKIAQDLPGIVDVVGYLAQEEVTEGTETYVQRLLLINNWPGYAVKARLPENLENVPDEIVEPTITNILDTLGYDK